MQTLNEPVLAELQSFMAPDEFMEWMEAAQQKLLEQAPVLLQRLADQQWEEARRLAHRLKGTLGSMGCDRLYAALNTLEEGLRQTPPVTPQAQAMAELNAILQATERALTQQCALARSAVERRSAAAAAPSPPAHGLAPQPKTESHKAE
jgi:HPt (histidine-containing phosphotransfer) domain-containing protein